MEVPNLWQCLPTFPTRCKTLKGPWTALVRTRKRRWPRGSGMNGFKGSKTMMNSRQNWGQVSRKRRRRWWRVSRRKKTTGNRLMKNWRTLKEKFFLKKKNNEDGQQLCSEQCDQYVPLSVCRCLWVSVCVRPSVCLSVCLSVRLCLCLCLSDCVWSLYVVRRAWMDVFGISW